MDLKKTKVPMYSSENNINILIKDFNELCSERYPNCDGCRIVRGHNGSREPHFTKCMARYIYERIIDPNNNFKYKVNKNLEKMKWKLEDTYETMVEVDFKIDNEEFLEVKEYIVDLIEEIN